MNVGEGILVAGIEGDIGAVPCSTKGERKVRVQNYDWRAKNSNNNDYRTGSDAWP